MKRLSKLFLCTLFLLSVLSLPGFFGGGAGGDDQVDFPDIYIDASAGDGGVGSQADPYNDFSDINWTTGGDNSVTDAVAGGQDVTINLKKGEEWREQLTVGASGVSGHPITIQAYGSGADPIINGADLVTGWSANTGTSTTYPAESADDARTWTGSGYSHTYNQVSWGNQNVTYPDLDGGIRFINIQVPKGAVINSAFVRGTAFASRSGTACNATIKGEQNASPNKFSNYVDFWGRSRTSATVSWNGIATWTNGTQYDTPDISTIVSEITSLAGWSSGNNLVIFFEDNSSDSGALREFSSYDYNSATEKAELHISYEYSNVWQATVTTEPDVVFFDGTRGNKQTAIGDVDSDKDWYWTSNVLYVYATSDPGTAYTNPGIEAGARDKCIYGSSKNYITVQNITVTKSNERGIFIYQSNNWTIDNCTATYCGEIEGARSTNIVFDQSDYITVKNCSVYQAGTHGIFLYDGGEHIIIENNTVYNCSHANIDLHSGGSADTIDDIIVRYNKSYYTSDYQDTGQNGGGFYVMSESGQDITNFQVYYNLFYNNHVAYNHGSQIYSDSTTASGKIYNNVFYKTALLLNNETGTTEIKNNIGYISSNSTGVFRCMDSTNKTVDNNCWDVDSGTLVKIDDATGGDGPSFDESEWSSYQSETGFDYNGLNTIPLMTDPGNGDFTLQATSPCIDAGIDVELTTDYAGNPVPHGGYDIGAYENQDISRKDHIQHSFNFLILFMLMFIGYRKRNVH